MEVNDTKAKAYADRLVQLQHVTWKQRLRALNPYRIHLRKICKGSVLEVGCGIGRVLDFLDQSAVGVDHNEDAIKLCRLKGFNAFTTEDFFAQKENYLKTFDILLTSHVMEHMSLEEGKALLKNYLPFLKQSALIILITPQEKGFDSDSSHVAFIDFEKQKELLESVGFKRRAFYSFPFPRFLGTSFIYNEFVSIGANHL